MEALTIKFDFGNLSTAVQISANMYGRRVEMQNTKLTVRVPKDLIENVKHYAQQNNTTLTALIEAYLRRIPPQEPFDDAPIGRFRRVGEVGPLGGAIEFDHQG